MKLKLAVVFSRQPDRPFIIVADNILDLIHQLQNALMQYGDFELMYRIY